MESSIIKKDDKGAKPTEVGVDILSPVTVLARDTNSTLSVERTHEIIKETRRFIKEVFRPGVDYEIRGKGKNQRKDLLKSGAEKLMLKFLLRPEFELLDKKLDWVNKIFYFEFKCRLFHIPTGLEKAQYVASCNSREENYCYRWTKKKDLPPGVDEADLVSKLRWEVGGQVRVYRLDNPYIEDQINTIVQMAQKRSFIGAIRIATQTSDDFTIGDNGKSAGSSEDSQGKSGRAPAKGRSKGETPEDTEELLDRLYGHFLGDEDAVQEFCRKVLGASGKIPLKNLPPEKLEKIREALEEKMAQTQEQKPKGESESELPF